MPVIYWQTIISSETDLWQACNSQVSHLRCGTCPPSIAIFRKANFPHLVPKWAHPWPTWRISLSLSLSLSLWISWMELRLTARWPCGESWTLNMGQLGIRAPGTWVLSGSLSRGRGRYEHHLRTAGMCQPCRGKTRYRDIMLSSLLPCLNSYSSLSLAVPLLWLSPIQAKCHLFHEDFPSLVDTGPGMSQSSTYLTLGLGTLMSRLTSIPFVLLETETQLKPP